jgi:hypothetical protein
MNTTMNHTFLRALPLLILTACFAAGNAQAQFLLQRTVMAHGAVKAATAERMLNATIGQPVIAGSRQTAYAGFFGFWYNAGSVVVSIGSHEQSGPYPSLIEAVYPHPARTAATVVFTLPEAGQLRMTLHDVLGRELALLDETARQPGRHVLELPRLQLPSGMYIIRMVIGERWSTTRILVQ